MGGNGLTSLQHVLAFGEGVEARVMTSHTPATLSQVCVDAWCDLEVPLAKEWGARLEPIGTLAQGARRCDFRWRVEERR